MGIAPIPNRHKQVLGAAWSFRTGDRVFQAEVDRALTLLVGRLQQGSGNHSRGKEGKVKERYGVEGPRDSQVSVLNHSSGNTDLDITDRVVHGGNQVTTHHCLDWLIVFLALFGIQAS